MKPAFKRNAFKLLVLTLVVITAIFAFSSCGEKSCKHEYEDTVVSPTCTAEGYTLHTCKKCGENYTDSEVEKIAHSYTETSIVAPTCQSDGEATFECTACGDIKNETLAKDPNAHVYQDTVKNPTCTENGYTTHTCACGASYNDTETLALNHSFTDTVVPPTCTAQGYTTHTCSNCTYSYKDTYVATIAHSYSEVVTPSTCKSQGYTTYTCSCTHTYIDNYTPKRTHDWDEGEVTTQPKCLVEGVKTFECKYDDCNEIKTESVAALSHSYSHSVVAPTCEEQGYTVHTCTNGCNHSYKDSYTSATGHSWPVATFSPRGNDGIEITKPATCEEEGVITYTCQNDDCGATKEEKIPPTGHDTEGNTATVQRVAAAEKCTYTATYTTPCHNDGCSGSIEVKQEVIHNYYWKITREATCKASGEKVYTCSVCEAAHPTELPKSFDNADAHNWVAGEAVNGVTPYTCSECNETKGSVVSNESSANVDKNVFESADSIELSEAELEFGSGVSSKLTEGEEVSVKAETLDKTAKDTAIANLNDEKLKEKIGESEIYNFQLKSGNNEIHELGDTVVVKIKYTLEPGEDPDSIVIYYIKGDGTIQEVSATYSNGYAVFETDHFSYYTVVRLSAEELCEKLTHKFEDTVYLPTCIRDGYTIKTCSRCGKTERVEGDKAYGHDHDADVTAPTCSSVGYTTYTCKNSGCNHTYVSDYTDKLIHSWDGGTQIEATCKEQGYTIYRCQNGDCDASYTEDFTDFADHSWNSGSFTKTPSCTESGIRTYKCTVCDIEKDEYVAALEHSYSSTVKKPSCTEGGYTLHQCAGCDSNYKDNYTDIIPHKYNEGICSSCDKVCAHTFGAYSFNNDATCTADGTETAACTECDVKNTRTKAGSATGHNYANSICTKCGDGCNHSWGAYVSNGDASCEKDGTKTKTCSSCGAKQTILDEGTKTKHNFINGVCDSCKNPCSHEYVDGTCKHCGLAENNFYATFLSSILTSDSFLVEIDDSQFFMNVLSESDLIFEAIDITSAKASLEFTDGAAIIKIVAEGSVTIDSENCKFKVLGVTNNGLLIIKTEITYKNGVTDSEYIATEVNLSALDMIFGAIDQNVVIEEQNFESEAEAIDYAKNILMAKFPNTIGNLVGNIIEAAFTKTPTENGYALTFNAENLHALNDKLLNGSIADAADIVLGEGAFEDIIEFLANSLDKDVKVALADICEYFVENDKITEEEIDAFIFVITDGETIDEIPDMTVKQLLTKLIDMPSSLVTKEVIKYAAERFDEISVYDLVSLIMSMNGNKVKSKQIHEFVAEYIDIYASFGTITIYTDEFGRFISLDADIDFDITSLPIDFDGSHAEGSLDLNASITRNKVLIYDFSAIISDFADSNIDTDITDLPDRTEDDSSNAGINDGYQNPEITIINNGDGTYTVIYKAYSRIRENGKFVTTYNGVPCTVIYSSETLEIFTAIFTERDLILFNNLCLGNDFKNSIKYIMAPLGETTYSYTKYERFYDNDGKLLCENKISEEIEYRPEVFTFAFLIDRATNNLADVLVLDYIHTHYYEIDGFEDLDLSEVECGTALMLDATCWYCGEKSKKCYYVDHNVELETKPVENGKHCSDGVTVSGKCSDCGKVIGEFENPIYDHVFEISKKSEYYTEYECACCGEKKLEISGWISNFINYVDENDTLHTVYVYSYYSYKQTIIMVDNYLDSDGNAYVDYYFNVINVNGEYTYSEKISYVHEAEVEEDVDTECNHPQIPNPEPQTKTETDTTTGNVTETTTSSVTCPDCETVFAETNIVIKDSNGNVICEILTMSESGNLVYESEKRYEYIKGERYETYSKENDIKYERVEIYENRYDADGRITYASYEIIADGLTTYRSESYSYNKAGEQIITADVSKMLYNGKLIAWVTNTYEGEGCSTKKTTTYYNAKGEISFSVVEENAHKDIVESYTLAPGSMSCYDGYIVSVYCNACKKVVETRIEKGDHPVQTTVIEKDGNVLEIQSCPCGNNSNSWVKGNYNHRYVFINDKPVTFFVFENGNVFFNIEHTEYDFENCTASYKKLWYYASDFSNVLDENGNIAENVELVYEVVYSISEYHVESSTETIVESTENGNKVITKTVECKCEHCGIHIYTETVKTVTNGDKLVSVYESRIYANGSKEIHTETYDSNGELIHSIHEYFEYDYCYVEEYTYYSCGYSGTRRQYYNGILEYEHFDINSNHNYGYRYEYVTPGSDSCEDGICQVKFCRVCGVEKKSDYIDYSHIPYDKILWSTDDCECGSETNVYVKSCLCGENSEENLKNNGYDKLISEEQVNSVYVTTYELRCAMCGDAKGYIVRHDYEEATSCVCETKDVTVYYCGTSLDNLTEVLRNERLNINHQMGVIEPSDKSGTAANGNSYTEHTDHVNCTQCDYNTDEIVYEEYDSNGKRVYREVTNKINGVVVSCEKIKYTNDSLGNEYVSERELKNSHEWFKEEFTYDFASCSYNGTKYWYDEGGNVYNTNYPYGSCHVNESTKYVLTQGTSCNNGTVYERSTCARCKQVYSEKQVYNNYDHNNKNFVSKEIIVTECGKIEISLYRCPCNDAIERVDIDYPCEFQYSNSEHINGAWVYKYTCAITDCAYSYTKQTVYEKAPGCMRHTYDVYRFGISGNDYLGDCDYTVKVRTNYSVYHETEYSSYDDHDGYRCTKHICKDCGKLIIETHYDEKGNTVYSYSLNGDGSWTKCTREFDEYNRYTLEHYEYSWGNWSKYYYEYSNDSPCEYTRYTYYESEYTEKYFQGSYDYNNHWWSTRQLTNSCTQYNTLLKYCTRCDEQTFDEYGSPTCHDYQEILEGGEVVGYRCSYCGMKNDTDVNGYFILENLSKNYYGYAAGFYFPYQNEMGDWELYFSITVLEADGETTRVEVVELDYSLIQVYSSGEVYVNADDYRAARNNVLADGESAIEFTFNFTAYDSDSGTYIEHKLTLEQNELYY